MSGLDRTNMPFSAKPADASSSVYINGQSRTDATQQMRDILENSRLDESILSADLPPTAYHFGFTLKPSTDPTQQLTEDQTSVTRKGPSSKFDELYQQALRNAESILSDSGNPPDGPLSLQNLHSPIHLADFPPSDNESRLETSVVQTSLHPVQPVDKSLGSGQQNGFCLSNGGGTRDSVGKAPDSLHLQGSGAEQPPALGVPANAVDKSVDSGRVNDTEISSEYVTEEDDIEEIVPNSQ